MILTIDKIVFYNSLFFISNFIFKFAVVRYRCGAVILMPCSSVHYPNHPCGDGEETPLTRHCFFMTVSFPLSVL